MVTLFCHIYKYKLQVTEKYKILKFKTYICAKYRRISTRSTNIAFYISHPPSPRVEKEKDTYQLDLYLLNSFRTVLHILLCPCPHTHFYGTYRLQKHKFQGWGMMGSAAPKPLFIYQKYKGFSKLIKEKYFRIGF